MTAQSHQSTVEIYPVRLEVRGAMLDGQLALPVAPRGVVLFAHGSGSGRHSPRNKQVAQALRESVGAGTLLVDLLSPAEEAVDVQTGALRFDVGLLASRVVAICEWIGADPRTKGLPLGLFGASTGAAAALIAASERPHLVDAVVSRGGRPDLVSDAALARVAAPTLLIVGANDPTVLDLNRVAADAMTIEHEVAVVAGAGHLFEEPGKLAEVSELAATWFDRYLVPPTRRDGR